MDFLEIPDDKFGCSFLLVASTRAGKTSMMNYIYDRFFKKHISIIMSASLNSDAYDYIKHHAVLSDLYHPEVLHDIYTINHSTDNHYKFCVILDDLTNVRHCPQYKRLLCVMRNQRVSCIVSAQGISLFDKTARSNINFVLCGRLNSDAEIEKCIKEYFISYFPAELKMADKVRLYRVLTNDHWFLIIDQVKGEVFRSKLRPEQMKNE